MKIRILSLFLIGSCQLSAMETLVKPAPKAATEKSSPAAERACEAAQAFCVQIVSRFEQGILSQRDVQELTDLLSVHKEHEEVLFKKIGQFFAPPGIASSNIKAYLQVFLLRGEFEPSEVEQVGFLRSLIAILMAKDASSSLMVLMNRLDMLILCRTFRRNRPFTISDSQGSAEVGRGALNPRSLMVYFVRNSRFYHAARQLTDAQRAELHSLSRLELLKKRRDAIKNFVKLKKLEDIHAFVVANKHYFESVKDLVNAHGPFIDNTLLHELIQQEMLHKRELSVEIKYIVAYLIALGASIDIENLSGHTVRDLLYVPRFIDIAAFVSGINPVEQANMDVLAIAQGLFSQEEEPIASPMREATKSDGKLMHYKSALEREIEEHSKNRG